MKNRHKICLIGAGNMGEALVRGILKAGLYSKKEIVASDISDERLENIRSKYGIKIVQDNSEAVASSDYVFVAVKPGSVKFLIEEISSAIDKSKVIISIAAGVPVEKIRRWMKKDIPVIRVMPNIAIIVLEGAIAISPGPGVKNKDIGIIKKIFDSVGKTVILDECYLDAVTGLSGSGPAYIFTVIEALCDGGVKVGLPRDAAKLLAAQTVLGAAKMVLETGKHTANLKELVTSPGGTTIEGLYRIEAAGVRAGLMRAVADATKRSEDLGKGE